MNYRLIHNNLVYVFNGPINSLISLDTLKTIGATVYNGVNPNPVIAQFPEITALTIPEARVSVVLQNKTLSVGDQTIGTYEGRDIINLLSITSRIKDAITIPVISFGYNFIYQVEDGTFNHLSKKVSDLYIRAGRKPKPEGFTLKYALPNLIYVNDNHTKMTVKMSEAIINAQNEMGNFINININIHFNRPSLGRVDELKASYDDHHSKVISFIHDIWG